MSRLRSSWYYLRMTARTSIPASAFVAIFATAGIGLVGAAGASHSRVFFALRAFLIAYATAGTLLGCGVYHVFRKEEYPLYYNTGVSVRHLVACAVTVNAAVSAVLLLVLHRLVE